MKRQSLYEQLVLGLGFFTRLPMPRLASPAATAAEALWAAPVAGLAIGAVGALTYALAHALAIPAAAAAALALAATVITSGGLHEDGLSDTADGFGGGKTRERKLEIMRDSRIGAYGALAIGLSLLLRWSALAALPGPLAVAGALIAAHAASRATLPTFLHSLPSARTDGLSAGLGQTSTNIAIAAGLLGALALFAIGPLGALAAALALGFMTLLFMSLCIGQIGGHTGDTAGALQQIGEIAVLMAASAVLT